MTQLYSQELTRNTQVDVTATSTEVAKATFKGQERTMILLRNTSPNVADIVTISFGNNKAVANNGIVLQQGEAMTDADGEGYRAWQGNIQAICATANGKLSIFER